MASGSPRRKGTCNVIGHNRAGRRGLHWRAGGLAGNQGASSGEPVLLQSQGEIKARLDDTLNQVQRISAIFANAAQRGRAGELVLENLLEETGMDRHRDFDLQVGIEGGRPDVVLNLPGRGRLVIDAKFPLDDFQRAIAAAGENERRTALAAHAKAVAGHVSALAKRAGRPGPAGAAGRGYRR
jgi:hypothetical protein